jgi:hypothetical protein
MTKFKKVVANVIVCGIVGVVAYLLLAITGMVFTDIIKYIVRHDLARPFFYPLVSLGTISMFAILVWVFIWANYNKEN